MSHIEIKYKDKTYNLHYTLAAIKTMEEEGFDINQIKQKPITMSSKLFHGAFIAEHDYLSDQFIEEIFANLPKKGLIEKLGEMYRDVIVSVTAEETDGETKNASWEVK